MILFKYIEYFIVNVCFNIQYLIRFGGNLNIFFGCDWATFKKDLELEEKIRMATRDENLQILNAHGYGVEEESSGIHLYDPKYYYVNKFKNHEELADWIQINVASKEV